MCGDATKPEHVERLLDGAKPALMVTDPPYGVSYDSSWRYKAGISTKDGAFGKSANDDQNDWQAAYALFPGRNRLRLDEQPRPSGSRTWARRLRLYSTLTHHLGQGAHRHWPRSLPLEARDLLVCRQEGIASQLEAGDRKASTLWEIDNPRKSETGHSAQKPVECMQRAIHNHMGDVYDPFVGSGTTVIAGEQEGRHRLRHGD